jgi:hypothetical protein
MKARVVAAFTARGSKNRPSPKSSSKGNGTVPESVYGDYHAVLATPAFIFRPRLNFTIKPSRAPEQEQTDTKALASGGGAGALTSRCFGSRGSIADD